MRGQILGKPLTPEDEFKLRLEAMSSTKWKFSQTRNLFWSSGNKQVIAEVDKILADHHIEHTQGQIQGSKDQYCVQITKTF